MYTVQGKSGNWYGWVNFVRPDAHGIYTRDSGYLTKTFYEEY